MADETAEMPCHRPYTLCAEGPFMRLPKSLLTATALALVAATAPLPMPASAQSDSAAVWHEAGTVLPVDAAIEPVYGKPGSDFSLIVWIDPECPYCKVFGKTPEMVVDASGGRINLAIRLLPLPMHGQAAFMAAATAICVGQQASPAAYYRFLDRYLELTGTNGAGVPEASGSSIEAVAREAGISDLTKLDTCVHSPETIRLLGEGFDAARVAGVTGTPAIVVRDNRSGTLAMTEGAIGGDEISRVVRTLGARAAN
jgi:hypothetical protein